MRKGDAQAAEPVIDKLHPAIDKATEPLPFTWTASSSSRSTAWSRSSAVSMLATGKFPRLSSLALAASLVPTTLAGHRFWEESDPQVKAQQQIHFFKNVSMLGGPDPRQRRHGGQAERCLAGQARSPSRRSSSRRRQPALVLIARLRWSRSSKPAEVSR